MDKVYIETSIVSHVSAWPSSNSATAVLQDQAKRWIANEATNYELVTSQFVIDEVSLGDPYAAARRLGLLENVRLLVPDADVELVADTIISRVNASKSTNWTRCMWLQLLLVAYNIF